jgi:glycosyltransferase involved in cell wall biosynthesis
MKIAILGTRGIPNYHGGFEQFAEYFSKYLAERGYKVYVYSSSLHPYQKSYWKGVKIIHKYDAENKIGTSGQFIYDLNCILDIRKRGFDVVFQLGYTSSAIWNWLIPKKVKLITNMDGLEWKRSKYSPRVQKFLKYSEKIAIKHSNILIADSLGIQEYLKKTYSIDSEYIAYGVQTDNDYDDSVLEELGVTSENYNMLIARIEPENNIETILDGVVRSKRKIPFLVIGNINNSFGKHLLNKFKKNSNVKFIGSIYNLPKLNSLRKNSNLYFHGHSAGGTNPSLLEAMASSAFICAHNNIFNRSILGDNAFYFSDKNEVMMILDSKNKDNYKKFISNNYERVISEFNWNKINDQYEQLI